MWEECRRVSSENSELRSRLARVESKIKREIGVGDGDITEKEQAAEWEAEVVRLREVIEKQELSIIQLHEEYQGKLKQQGQEVDKLERRLKHQDKQLTSLISMTDKLEQQAKIKEISLLQDLSNAIANVYDTDRMRTKIRAQLLKYEQDRKARTMEMFKMKKKLT